MAPRDLGRLLVLAGIWGSSFLFIRLGVEQMPAIDVVELRLIFGAVAVAVFAFIVGIRGIGAQLRRPLVAITGLCAAGIPFALFAYGETRVASGIAGIGNATTPLFAAAITRAVPVRLGGERLTPQRAVGLALGFGGVVALVGESISGSLDLVGVACCVLAPVFYGVGGVLARNAYREVDPVVAAVSGNALAAICMLPIAIPLGIPNHVASAGSLLAVAALGVLGTGFAFVIFYRLLASIGTATFTVTYLVPAFAVTEGALFLGEPLHPLSMLALVAILAGVAVSNGLVRIPARRAVPAVLAEPAPEPEGRAA